LSNTDYGWNDFVRVLDKLDWIEVPNRMHDWFTYENEFLGTRIIFYKENNYNRDYFEQLLRAIGISPKVFEQLAHERENSV
jgi:hypothetical protein